jgi:hypothetical protein
MENITNSTEKLLRFNVTCHTEGCENAEISIEISSYDEQPTVICGPCAQPIIDIVAL